MVKRYQSIYHKDLEYLKTATIKLENQVNQIGKRVVKDNSESWMWEISMLEEVNDKLEIVRNKIDRFAENSVQQEVPKQGSV